MSHFSNPYKARTDAPSRERAMKVPTFRSESLKQAVATLPCALCARFGPSQAAHCNYAEGDAGKCMGKKVSDAYLFSQCPECHRAIDQGGVYTKEERRNLEEKLNLRTLRTLVELGILHI